MSLKQLMFEEIRKIYGLWEIVKMGQVCFKWLMFMNCVALTFAEFQSKTWTIFLSNEVVSFLTKLSCLI
jgi:hypothetical protein